MGGVAADILRRGYVRQHNRDKKRHKDIRREGRREKRQPQHKARGIRHPAGTLRLWQDDHAQDDSGLRDADLRADNLRRRGHHRHSPASAPREHGVPEVRALSSSQRLQQHRVRAQDEAHPQRHQSEPQGRGGAALPQVHQGGDKGKSGRRPQNGGPRRLRTQRGLRADSNNESPSRAP